MSILTAALGSALVLASCSARPESASKDLYNDIAAGKIDAAIKYIDTADIPPASVQMGALGKLRISLQALRLMNQQFSALGGLKDVEVLSVTKLNDSMANVTVKLTFGDGQTRESTDTWTKVNGKWLIVPH